jgi:hypothetical protein
MTFKQVMLSTLPPRMQMPEEFLLLFDWMERSGCVGLTASGEKFGVPEPSSQNEKGGSAAYFCKPTSDCYWTGCWDEQEMSRLSTFMRTGWDGSSAAFWLDDDGNQHIVHLGSGSGSVMTGVWVKSPMDLLRLLAIGYVDLCWPEEYNLTPTEVAEREGDAPRPKFPIKYANWLTSTFGVTVPAKASELIGPMSRIGEASDDPFCKWLASLEARGLTRR